MSGRGELDSLLARLEHQRHGPGKYMVEGWWVYRSVRNRWRAIRPDRDGLGGATLTQVLAQIAQEEGK